MVVVWEEAVGEPVLITDTTEQVQIKQPLLLGQSKFAWLALLLTASSHLGQLAHRELSR